jgi:hypothetical protein
MIIQYKWTNEGGIREYGRKIIWILRTEEFMRNNSRFLCYVGLPYPLLDRFPTFRKLCSKVLPLLRLQRKTKEESKSQDNKYKRVIIICHFFGWWWWWWWW